MSNNLLTKSKYLYGLQCSGLLWTSCNDKQSIPKPDPAQQFIFDQGTEIGILAQKIFPAGNDATSLNFQENLDRTREFMLEKKPIFEAGFLKSNCFCRIDILNPSGEGWDIIEVKSSTSVKEINYHDVSFQRYCCELAGLKINKCFLMHINNKYLKDGEIDPNKLFIIEDITEDVTSAMIGIKERIAEMIEIISNEDIPSNEISPSCNDPYACPLKEKCWKDIPKDSVFELSRMGKSAFELYNQGIINIKDVPENYKLSFGQIIQRNCAIKGKCYNDKVKIKEFIHDLEYPLYFLDFETFNAAVPIFDGTRPYQQIPFQFSLHIVRNRKEPAQHISYLAQGTSDPRPSFIKKLSEVLGDSGSIIVFNAAFETSRLKEIAQAFPEHKDWVVKQLPRFVDLMIPFRKFYYYNPMQKGSASIKKVLPAITGKSYDALEINNGADAAIQFFTSNYKGNTGYSSEDIARIRSNLEKYCCLDTEGMIWILDELKNLCKEER